MLKSYYIDINELIIISSSLLLIVSCCFSLCNLWPKWLCILLCWCIGLARHGWPIRALVHYVTTRAIISFITKFAIH